MILKGMIPCTGNWFMLPASSVISAASPYMGMATSPCALLVKM